MLRRVYRWLFPRFPEYLCRELEDCHSILDLGCGRNSPLRFLPPGHYTVGVEMFRPYLEQSKGRGLHADYVLGDVRTVEFAPRSFDCVLVCDVLEHLSKEEGYELLRKIERTARKKTVVFTTNGFVGQEEYDENELQRHLSGWTAGSLRERGYRVSGINGFKPLRGELAAIRFRPVRLFAVLSDVTQLVTHRLPGAAFQLLAVKRLP